MREWLSQQQLTEYDAHRYFEVIGCHTGKRYRIYHGNGANVIELDDAARPRTGWCFVPRDHPVASDGTVELEGDRVDMPEVVERKFKGQTVKKEGER